MKALTSKNFVLSVLLLFIRVGSSGQSLIYERMLPLAGSQRVELVAVNDIGGYFLIGRQGNFMSLLRATIQGDTVFTRVYQFPVLVNSALPTATHYDSATDKLFVFGFGQITGGALNGFMVRLDTIGTVEAFQVFNQATFGAIDAVTPLPNGEFLLTGSRNYFAGGNIDVFITRVNANGIVLFDTSYAVLRPQEAFSIEPLYDGSFLIGGVTGTAQGPAAYALQVDLWGRVIRDTVIQTPQAPFNNTFVRFRQMADDGWILSGFNNTVNAGFYVKLTSNFGVVSNTYRIEGFGPNIFPLADSGAVFTSVFSNNASKVTLTGILLDTLSSVVVGNSTIRKRVTNLGFTMQGDVIAVGDSRNFSLANSDDYYYAKFSNVGLPFLKNLCRSAPVASFSVQDTGGVFVLRNTSTTGLQYNGIQAWEWYNPNTFQTSTDSVLVLPGNLPPGYPMVLRMRNYYGCTDTVQADVFQLLGGMAIASEWAPTVVYPNPAGAMVYVQPGSAHRGHVAAELVSLEGKVLGRHALIEGTATALPVHSMAAGVYLLRVVSAAHSEVLRWVKE